MKSQLPKALLWGVITCVMISCSGDVVEIEGDPAIVAEFDFAKAWKEAVPTTGAIVELDSVYFLDKAYVKYAKSLIGSYQELYEYYGTEYFGYINDVSRNSFLKQAIVNDMGDTIVEMQYLNSPKVGKSIWQMGFTELYSSSISGGIHTQYYLVEVDREPYDLMATMRSTYNSIKYLQ
jgi:hypothetical protein